MLHDEWERSITSQKNNAQILTQTSLPELTRLDASATIEVYVLTRMAELQSIHPETSKGNSSTEYDDDNDDGSENNDVIVRFPKTALGFRHIHRSSYRSVSGGSSKNDIIFELTLEYGPKRYIRSDSDDLLSVHDQETIPQIIEDGRQRKSVVFDNTAHVFYTTKIDRSLWKEAHFMAPITGAVLSKVLDYVLEYPILYPYYQPFEIVQNLQGRHISSDHSSLRAISDETNSYSLLDEDVSKVEIPSSSADDFVWKVISFLSDLYVNVNPVLIPPRYRTRIFVSDKPIRVAGDVGQMRLATDFYDRIYSCINHVIDEEISRNDDPLDRYSSAIPSLTPTSKPTIGLSNEPSNQPTVNDEASGSYSSSVNSNPSQNPTHASANNQTRNLVSDENMPYINMKTALVLSCLIDPYDDNILSFNNTAYIFEKGSQYLKLKLTYPYIMALHDTDHLPSPKTPRNGEAQLIDWILAVSIMFGFVSGIFAILQNIGLFRNQEKLERQREISSSRSASSKSDKEGLMMISIQEHGGVETSINRDEESDNGFSTKFAPIDLPIQERMLHTHSSQRYGRLFFGHSKYVSLPAPTSNT